MENFLEMVFDYCFALGESSIARKLKESLQPINELFWSHTTNVTRLSDYVNKLINNTGALALPIRLVRAGCSLGNLCGIGLLRRNGRFFAALRLLVAGYTRLDEHDDNDKGARFRRFPIVSCPDT